MYLNFLKAYEVKLNYKVNISAYWILIMNIWSTLYM